MTTDDTERRKFTLLDAIILIAAFAIAFKWAQAYRQIVETPEYITDGTSRTAIIRPFFERWFPLPVPFLAMSTIALFCLRFVAPRPRCRRLVRAPGFVINASAILGMAIAGLTLVMQLFGDRPSPVKMLPILYSLTLPMAYSAETVIAGALLTLALFGRLCPRRDRDWIETTTFVLGFCWVALGLVMRWPWPAAFTLL